MQKLSPVTTAKCRLKDEKGLYRLNGGFLKGSLIKDAKDVDPTCEKNRPVFSLAYRVESVYSASVTEGAREQSI
jgi:hypothetical protein